jgi:polar amino acid transport system permease protein
VNYRFEFSAVFAAWDELAWGAYYTIALSGAAMAIGLVVAIVGALAKTMGPPPVRFVISAYVEVIRNTPFPIQLFIIYFGLPSLGIRFSSNTAALIALVINFGAYGIEIVRAGIDSIGRGQIEAGRSLGMRPLQIFRHIVLKPAIQTTYPALASQFILLMLYSSVCSTIAATELTAAAGDIYGRTFRSFEVYFTVTLMYFIMSMIFWGFFNYIERKYVRTPVGH